MKLLFAFLALALLIGSSNGMGITTALNVTMTATPGITYLMGNATYNQTGTLPDAATANWKGVLIPVIVTTDPGTGYFRLNATGGDDVAGNNYYVTTSFPASLILTSDGTDYHIVGTPVGTWASHA